MSKFMQGSKALFNGINSLWNKLTGAGTTNAEKEAMQFNANQAELDRQFQSAEAEKARQWQEDYYQQYQSPAAMMRQYEQAGLNPALMYGGATGSSTAPSTSVPTGASASSGAPVTEAGSLLSTIMQAVLAKSQINLNNANANNANASAGEHNMNVEWKPKLFESEISKNYATTSNLLAGVQLLNQQVQQIIKNMELTDVQIDKVIAETDNVRVDTAKKELEKEGVAINNKLIAQKILQSIAETRLTNAQTILTETNTTGISLDNFIKQIDARNADASGGRPVDSLYGLIDKGVTNIAKPLQDLWRMIF